MFDDIRNRIDFFLRNKLRFSRKNYVEKDSEIIERCRLENIYTCQFLEKSFKKIEKESLDILDIGCKNWFYAKGEYDFFKTFSDKFCLDGVELDAYRLYSNFYSRYEVAKYHTRGLLNTNYIAKDLLDIEKKYDYIIWILPFVVIEPLIFWGLPKKYFCPQTLLNHAYNLLNQNGQMLIINQGENEAKAQKDLLEELNIPYKFIGEIEDKQELYKYKRYGYLVQKF